MTGDDVHAEVEPMSSILRRAVLLVACVAGLGVPAVASAASVTSDASTVTYTDATGQMQVGYAASCTVGGVSGDCVTFSSSTVSPTLSAGCATDGSTVSCLLGSRAVVVRGSAGADDLRMADRFTNGFAPGQTTRVTIDAGAGDDRIIGGNMGEALLGGPGADTVSGLGGDDLIDGGDGDDTLSGEGEGTLQGTSVNDVIRGGAGDDTLLGDDTSGISAIGRDTLDGGPGVDTIRNDWFRVDASSANMDPPATVTLDGVANDGRPGESDQVVGVEVIVANFPVTGAASSLTGSDGPERIHGNRYASALNLTGLGGDDDLAGGDRTDVIDGGGGNDTLSGGSGDDVITGGAGADSIDSDHPPLCARGMTITSCLPGTGNDTIHAVDGEIDTITCGMGTDTVNADAADVVAADCETVNRVSGVTPGTGTGAGTTPGTGTTLPATAQPAAAITFATMRLTTIARTRRITVTCRLARAGTCTVRALISRTDAKRMRMRLPRTGLVSIGVGSTRFTAAGRKVVVIRPTATIASKLRTRPSLRITFRTTAAYTAGTRITQVTRTVKR